MTESRHFKNVGSCGHVIARCRCPGKRVTYQMKWPCIPCQNPKREADA